MLFFHCATARSRLGPAALIRAAGTVAPGDPAALALARLRLDLGPPTFRRGETRAWAVVVGHDCYLIEVRLRGDVVTFVDDPGRVRRVPVDDPFEHCAQRANR